MSLSEELQQQISEFQDGGLLARDLDALRESVKLKMSRATRAEIAEVVAMLSWLGWPVAAP